jgi:hypothetical protein
MITPAARAGRFRARPDGPRLLDLHGEGPSLPALPRLRPPAHARCRDGRGLCGRGREEGRAHAGPARPSGSSAMAQCCSSSVRARACLAACVRCPDDGWSARADGHGTPPVAGEWHAAGLVRHGFTHFDLELQLMLCRSSADCASSAPGEFWPGEAVEAAGLPHGFCQGRAPGACSQVDRAR